MAYTISLVAVVLLISGRCTFAEFAAEDISTSGLTPEQLVEIIERDADIMSITDVVVQGQQVQFGTFSGGLSSIGMDKGIVIGTGHVSEIDSKNDASADTTLEANSNSAVLESMTGTTSHDVASLEFSFVPNADKVSLSYVFGSEEYDGLEAPTKWIDSVAIMVNEKNCALIGSGMVNVNTVNAHVNADLFMDNANGTMGIELHGFSVGLQCTAEVNPGAKNTMQIMVADGFEGGYDSAVFVRAESFGIPPGFPCMPHQARGKCLRLLETGDFTHPHCLVDDCHVGYTLDEEGEECCDLHYVEGFRSCEGLTGPLAMNSEVCCEPFTAESARPNGRTTCFD